MTGTHDPLCFPAASFESQRCPIDVDRQALRYNRAHLGEQYRRVIVTRDGRNSGFVRNGE